MATMTLRDYTWYINQVEWFVREGSAFNANEILALCASSIWYDLHSYTVHQDEAPDNELHYMTTIVGHPNNMSKATYIVADLTTQRLYVRRDELIPTDVEIHLFGHEIAKLFELGFGKNFLNSLYLEVYTDPIQYSKCFTLVDEDRIDLSGSKFETVTQRHSSVNAAGTEVALYIPETLNYGVITTNDAIRFAHVGR